MRTYKFTTFLAIFALVAAVLTAMATLNGRGGAQRSSQNKYEDAEFDSQFPLTDYDAPEPSDPKKNSDRKAKAKRYNKVDKAVAPHLMKVAEHYHWPADFPPVPVGQSDAVVVGSVLGAEAHLSEDKSGVFSEFATRVEEIIKQDGSQYLAPNRDVVLEREGGRVRFSSGHVVHLYVVGLGMPRAGKRYVFFLKRTPLVDSSYSILTAYELRAGRVYPLDRSGVVPFDKYYGVEEERLLDEVRSAANPAQPSLE